MAFEKKWGPIPLTAFTADGTSDGQIQVADAFSLKVNSIVYLKSNTHPDALQVKVKRVIDPVTFLVGRPSYGIDDRLDVSAFKVADSAQVYNSNYQDRPKIGPEDYNRAVFDEEPVVALRTIMVDRGGRYIGTDPTSPMYIRLTDGSVNIGTVNAEIEVQLSHKDNVPNPGDVADSTRIGDGTTEWSMTLAGEGKVSDQTTHDKLDTLHGDSTQLDSDLNAFAAQNHTDLTSFASQEHTDNLQTQSDINAFASQNHTDNVAIESKLDTLHSDNVTIEGKLDTLHADNLNTQSDVNSFAAQNHADLGTIDSDLNAFAAQSHADNLQTQSDVNSFASQNHTDNVAIEGKLDTLHSDNLSIEGKLDTLHTDNVTTQADVNAFAAQNHTDLTTTNTEIGPTNETAPATDTAASGLNGRLQRVAQRLTTVDTDLLAFKAANHTDLAQLDTDLLAFKAANHTDVTQVDTDLLAFKAANHTDLVQVDTDLVAFKNANHTDLTQVDTDLVAFKNANHTDLTAFATQNHADNGVIEGKQDIQITSLQLIDDIPHAQNAALNKGVPAMGQLDEVSTVAATEDNVSVARITPQRAIHSNLRDSNGGEIATLRSELKVASTTKLVGEVFESALDSLVWSNTLVGTGSIAVSSSVAQLQTGTTANSSAVLNSVHKGRFLAGTVNAIRMAARLGDTGTANNIRRWGAYDANNGVYFQINGTTFGIGIRSAASDTIITSFNRNSPTVDTNFHNYEIQFTEGAALFYQDGLLIHSYATTVGALCATPSLLIGAENTNSGGGTSNVSLYVRGAGLFRYGEAEARKRLFHSNFVGRVQNVSGTSSGAVNSFAVTLNNPSTAGNCLIAAISVDTNTINSITDNKGQTWTQAAVVANTAGGNVYLYYVPNTLAGVTTLTVTIGVLATSAMCVILSEYFGVNATSPLDKISTNQQTTNVTAVTSGSTAATAQAIELLFGAHYTRQTASDAMTPGSGFTSLAVTGGNGDQLYAQDQIVTAIGTYASTATAAAAHQFFSLIGTFKMTIPANAALTNFPQVLKSGPGTLKRIIINTAGQSGSTLSIYDGTSTSGTLIATLSLASSIGDVAYDLDFDNGLTIVVNSTTSDFTILYD